MKINGTARYTELFGKLINCNFQFHIGHMRTDSLLIYTAFSVYNTVAFDVVAFGNVNAVVSQTDATHGAVRYG